MHFYFNTHTENKITDYANYCLTFSEIKAHRRKWMYTEPWNIGQKTKKIIT